MSAERINGAAPEPQAQETETALVQLVDRVVVGLGHDLRAGLEAQGKDLRAGMESASESNLASVKTMARIMWGMLAVGTVLVVAIVGLSGGTLYLKYQDAEIHTGASPAAEPAP
jgi:hypothetical protein